jgi:NAD(P)-dependent dehydrogenase (short-subunit alcohol dehydrogenase family)
MKTRDALLLGAAGAGLILGARYARRRRQAITFAGKVVLITGGSRGLGLTLARLLAMEGAKVALCARDADELERAREEIAGGNIPAGAVFVNVCDVTDPPQVRETVVNVRDRYGRIDILINNAGTIQVGPMEEMTDADYEEAMRVHFWAPYHFVQAVLPEMRARREGRIVNIASIGGLLSVPHLLPYAASKSALVGFSEGLRAELKKDNVLVTTVCPGLMRTGSPRNAYFKGQNEKEYAWFKLSDSLPVTSTSAEAAARQIIDALRHGDPFLVTSLPAQGAALLHGLFPGLTADALGAVNRLLPAPGGIGQERRTGADSESPVNSPELTALTNKTARYNTEMADAQALF